MALLHVFGDSHAHYLFSRAPGAIVNWLGPYTMHRIGRDGVDFLGRRVNDGDKVLFVFGEIDVRCHMVRVDRERGNGIESVATDLASRYTAAVMQASVGLPRSTFAILGVVPPIDPMKPNPELPVVGTLAERIEARETLNRSLSRYSRDRRILYVPFPKSYERPDGSLRRHLSDGHAHIAMDCAEPVCRAASFWLDTELNFQPSSTVARIAKAAGRRAAIAGRHHLALYKLGTA